MAYETFEDGVENLPRFIDEVYNRRRFAFGAGLSEPPAVRGSAYPAGGQISGMTSVRLEGPTPSTHKTQAKKRDGQMSGWFTVA
jgi:hypothetical protein